MPPHFAMGSTHLTTALACAQLDHHKRQSFHIVWQSRVRKLVLLYCTVLQVGLVGDSVQADSTFQRRRKQLPFRLVDRMYEEQTRHACCAPDRRCMVEPNTSTNYTTLLEAPGSRSDLRP